MRIIAMPMFAMQQLRDTQPHLLDKVRVISINGSGDTACFAGVQSPNLLTLHFEDIEPKDMLEDSKYVLFDDAMARQVVEFLENTDPEKDSLLVHCGAGVSRSGAVATFAFDYFREHCDYEQFRRDNQHISPNMHVLQLLRRAAFGSEY